MSRLLRTVLNLGVSGGIVFGGYLLMKYTVPDKETMLKRLPNDLKDKDRLERIEKDNERLFQVMQENIKSNDPIWKIKGLKDPWTDPSATNNNISTPAFTKE